MLCKCCYARLPEEECETCRMADCDASLDSVQCRPEHEPPQLMTALQWALAEGRWEDAADLLDPTRDRR